MIYVAVKKISVISERFMSWISIKQIFWKFRWGSNQQSIDLKTSTLLLSHLSRDK